MPPSEAGRFWNFYTEFVQFGEYFEAKFMSLLSFIFLLKQCLFPFLSSSFSVFLPFLFPLLFFFPFLSLFLLFSFFLPFFFSLLPFFSSFSFPFHLLSFPIFFSPSRFLVSGGGGSLPPCPPIGYAPGLRQCMNIR